MALGLAGPTGVGARTWSNSVGRSFEAEFVKVHGSDVIFKSTNGRVFSTPISELSAASQAQLHGGGGKVVNGGRKSVSVRRRMTGPVAPSTFGWSWPRRVKLNGAVESKVISEDRKSGRYIYESPGYRFTCDARVTQDAVRNFAVMFESTRQYAGVLPLSMKRSGGSGKLDIRLFGEMEAYVRAGGPPGSAGVFIPSRGCVLVPMSSLGLVKGNTGFSLDPKRQNNVLIHELAHQLTPEVYFVPGAVGWFSEGLAEYMAVTPYNWGFFNPDIYGNVVKDYVTARGSFGTGGRNLGTRVVLPPLKQFLLMDYRQFAGRRANVNYGAGLLVVHYFFHMEGGGGASRVTRFLKGLQSGRSGEAALRPLLGGGTYEKLQADIRTAWAKKGVEIRFAGS